MSRGDLDRTKKSDEPATDDAAAAHPVVVPFLLGAAVGGVAGAVVGTLLSDRMSHAVAALVDLLDRRLSSTDRDELRFDLLLQ